jgi:hypothetical protein
MNCLLIRTNDTAMGELQLQREVLSTSPTPYLWKFAQNYVELLTFIPPTK